MQDLVRLFTMSRLLVEFSSADRPFTLPVFRRHKSSLAYFLPLVSKSLAASTDGGLRYLALKDLELVCTFLSIPN